MAKSTSSRCRAAARAAASAGEPSRSQPSINSGGAAGKNDVHDAVRTAVINKRAGGCGLIMGRKAFQKPRQEGAALIQRVQDVYLDPAIPIA